ncbi:Eaa1 [Klebsiella pneumoniae]|nr:Eaa1 [Klebsiella pneumoniae]SYG58148.1 Eaa1 [Klebsiella pneumoniae]
MVLSAMDSEPVAEVLSNRPGNDTSTIDRALPVGTQLYRHAQPAKDREQVRSEHAEWSQATFGNVGPVGPLKHLSKEALEAAAEPGDLSEWADMQFLLWDAQRRAGITDEQITQAMFEKLAVNKQREWPEPKDGEPRLHIKEQPAPVVPNGLRLALSNAGIAAPESDEMLAATCEKHIQALVTWVKDRKPFQSAPVVPSFEEWLSAANRKPLGWVKDAMREAYDACRAAMLSGGKS